MVTIKDGCGCDPCDCDWKQKLKEAYSRAIQSVNKIGDNDGSVYFPDGTGFVKLPLPRQSDVAQIKTNAQDITDLKVADAQLQTNITAEETARKAKDELLDADITRIDNTDAGQDQRIRDNADRITSTYNDLVATEATVATHDSEIITLQAQAQALSKSLVSDVMMTDGTTAGSVQVSIKKEDGAVVTSANYKWGRDIGVRLEAGTQAGYIKTVISLSDGTVLESNEYKIVEVLESDVYVTAITLVPDMAAGTIGGNISYSNGTTQTINTINVPTAPGVTSAIEALQTRMTAVEQKNTAQDSQISALDARVQAIEDTPGISQFASGKLGTIAGSTADGRIKAEDDGTGSVNGWSDLKNRMTTAEGQIVAAQNGITAIETKNTQQDTAINGLQTSKVNVAQGVANAGKALVVGDDGNVTPAAIEGGKSPVTSCSIKMNDYLLFNDTTTVNSASYLIQYTRNIGNSTQYPNVEYDCPFCTIYEGPSVSVSITALRFINPTDSSKLVKMFNSIFNKLNVDISKLPNGTYYVGIKGVDRPYTIGGGGTFFVDITNGSISDARPEMGSLYSFPGDPSTYYCNVGLSYFYKYS